VFVLDVEKRREGAYRDPRIAEPSAITWLLLLS
jgi:hypothetical protein